MTPQPSGRNDLIASIIDGEPDDRRATMKKSVSFEEEKKSPLYIEKKLTNKEIKEDDFKQYMEKSKAYLS